MSDAPESHSLMFLGQVCATAKAIDAKQIEEMAERLAQLRYRGRLFILGVGGSAANASHAVNDFRKLCGIEAYAPTDNVAELTARTNDDGWGGTFSMWLEGSRLEARDAIMVLSVGGGDKDREISLNLVNAVSRAKIRGAAIFGIVGRDGGWTKLHGDCVIHIPTVDTDLVTPLAESFQSIVLHSLVSHPKLAVQKAKWEGMDDVFPREEHFDDGGSIVTGADGSVTAIIPHVIQADSSLAPNDQSQTLVFHSQQDALDYAAHSVEVANRWWASLGPDDPRTKP